MQQQQQQHSAQRTTSNKQQATNVHACPSQGWRDSPGRDSPELLQQRRSSTQKQGIAGQHAQLAEADSLCSMCFQQKLAPPTG
jgi:hypothetical protein